MAVEYPLTIDQRRFFTNQEKQPYSNTRYVLQMRLRAANNLLKNGILKDEDKASTIDPIMAELTRVEAWITEYDAQLDEIEADEKAAQRKDEPDQEQLLPGFDGTMQSVNTGESYTDSSAGHIGVKV